VIAIHAFRCPNHERNLSHNDDRSQTILITKKRRLFYVSIKSRAGAFCNTIGRETSLRMKVVRSELMLRDDHYESRRFLKVGPIASTKSTLPKTSVSARKVSITMAPVKKLIVLHTHRSKIVRSIQAEDPYIKFILCFN